MPEPIIIDNFQRGIADSPHTGFADMRNVVIDKQTGVAEINWRTQLVASTAVGDFVKWIIHDEVTGTAVNFYATTDSGRLLRTGNNGETWITVTNGMGRGQGLGIFKDHLLIATGTAITGYGPLSTTPIFNTNFVLLDAKNDPTNFQPFWNPIKVGQDDICYIGDGNLIDSIQEVSGQNFNPGTASTYTYGTASLDLPEGYIIKNIEELGVNLLSGTWKASGLAGTLFEEPQVNVADIFPWDRSADSSFEPVRLKENGINWQITVGNITYFQAGLEGKIYATNGSSVRFIKQLPKHLTNLDSRRLIISSPSGVMHHRGKIYFSIASSGTSGQELEDGVGVYSLDLETGALVMEHQISTGNTGGTGTNVIKIRALQPIDRTRYFIGFEDANIGGGLAYGIDRVSNTERYTSYAARIDSKFFSVATEQNPRDFSTLEFELAKPLLSGQGIRFSRRTNLADGFTGTATFDFATNGGITTDIADFRFQTKGGVQIRTELTTGAASTTTVELKSIRLR